jgi:diguanylate cyclase (GGDEF)-like protein
MIDQADSEMARDGTEKRPSAEADDLPRQRDHAADLLDHVSDHRDHTADRRDHDADERDQTADRRDLDAEERDQAADRRDLDADERDRAAEGYAAQLAVEDGSISAEVLDRSAQARREAASDREQSSHDRGDAARERTDAGTDRDMALADRAAGAGERSDAGTDRNIGRAAREISAREREYATRDGLTGALLRDAGLAEVEREIARVRRAAHPLVLAFIDVDHLKAVNDSLGHVAGDRLLVEVASTIRAQMRSYDLIVRYGGDEFLCVLSGLSMSAATARLELINTVLAAGAEHGSITVGLAELQPGDSAASLIARADAALYRQRS